MTLYNLTVEGGSNIFLHNLGIHLPDYRMSQPRKPKYEFYYEDQIKEDEISGACSTHDSNENCM
jgi:hypothetical protein